MKKDKSENVWQYLFITSLCFIIGGIIMLIGDMYFVGYRPMYAKVGSIGGIYILALGLLFLVCTYFSLSPFGSIRKAIDTFFKKFKF